MTVTKLLVNINDQTEADLRELSDRKTLPVTEIFRRAVSVLNFLDDQAVAGKEIQIIDKRNGILTEIEFLT